VWLAFKEITQTSSIPIIPRKVEHYREYIYFFNSLAKVVPDKKKLDEALMSYGQYLKGDVRK
jgi:hypothetical protein